MKPTLLFLLLPVLTLNSSHGITPVAILPALQAVNKVVGIIELGLTIYDMFILKKEDEISPLATESLLSLSQAFEKFELELDNRLNSLHSTVKFQHFQETVSFPAHNMYMTAYQYLKSQSNFMEHMLINECLKNAPYTRLNNLNIMISHNWFINQVEHQNYRFPDVESLRIRVVHVVKQLVLSHFICMAVQGEPVEDTVLTGAVISTVYNITGTIDKNLNVIENSFFPRYVVKEVKNLIEESSFSDNETTRKKQMADATFEMLKTTFGPGIVVNSENCPLFLKSYQVQISKFPTVGQMPKDAIVDIKIHDYYILVTRAHSFKPVTSASMDDLSERWPLEFRNKIFTTDCKFKEPILISEDHDVFALTPFTLEDNVVVIRPFKKRIPNIRCFCFFLCDSVSYSVTSVPANLAADPISEPLESDVLQPDQQVQSIKDIRRKVRVELKAVGEQKQSSFSQMAAFSHSWTMFSFERIVILILSVVVNTLK